MLASRYFIKVNQLGKGAIMANLGFGFIYLGNAYELSVFLESLMKGALISEGRLDEMINWFDLSEDDQWEAYGQVENGFGLEKFGDAVGHTGGIDGFNSFGFYFSEEDMTYILLINGIKGESDAQENIFNDVLKVMFE